jgi:hypothetical protein
MSEAVIRPFPLKSPLRVLSSLRLTVICLGLGMLLVFLGTLAQVHLGIHAVQARYFQSLLIYWSPPGARWKIPVLPGGYLLGTVLLVNLIAAHAVRFQLTKKKLGIILLHFGVILLLIGQLLTGLFARETQMRIDEGQTLGYSEAPREVELAVIDKRRSADDGSAEVMNVIGDVAGRTCIIQDDIIDTAGTITKAATALKANGAGRVLACAVHGVLSGPAVDRIEKSPIDKLIVTNTIPLAPAGMSSEKIVVLSVARLLGQAIKSIHEETSVSSLFV